MSHKTNSYEFGPYYLDLRKRVLMRDGEGISLTPKATDILVMLVTNAGQLVEKDELLREVWPDTFVEESNLAQNIFVLRQALGDDRAEHRYIETVAKRGYRFIAPVKLSRTLENESVIHHPGNAAKTAFGSGNKPVIAVLPFVNEDTDLNHFASDLTDNIIHKLSRFPKVRVMSRSSIVRFKTELADPQNAGKELGVDAVFVGKIASRPTISIDVEFVDVRTGWQLWGQSFDGQAKDLHELQDTIAQHVLRALTLTFTDDRKSRATTRYTENSEAYRSYLEGRYECRKYTPTSIEKAISHFQHAIESDPNYALAYAAIVDCFLRLATNYLPPGEFVSTGEIPVYPAKNRDHLNESDSKVELRLDWDCKAAERELHRANELKMDYLGGHQWYAAYRTTRQFYVESSAAFNDKARLSLDPDRRWSPHSQIVLLELTPNEEVQVFCAIAREQIDIGNYKAACQVLTPWWSFGIWPKLDGLDQRTCADLLFTAGVLAGCVASTKQLPRGQKHSEELLNGSVALFEQLGFRNLASEGRIELAHCYYRQGLFDAGRQILTRVLDETTDDCSELRSLALIRLATLERHAGRPSDALSRLSEATKVAELCGPWATGRRLLELASSYKELMLIENVEKSLEEAKHYYSRALYEFEGIGNHRLSAITENNLGFLMMLTGSFQQAESHLLRAQRSFNSFDDKIRSAQVDDSLARLYFAQGRFNEAEISIQRAVQTMENGDEDAVLAEALTTKGLIYCKLGRYSQAKTLLEHAYRLDRRCGDIEGAGRALAVLVEELFDLLESEERNDIADRIRQIILNSQDFSIHDRLQKCLAILA